MSSTLAEKRVNDFERKYGEVALQLAYHAALPVALNADLLHLLRINFFLDPPAALPYTAEFELLLSPLCREIDEGLYEIEPESRDILLQGLCSIDRGQRLRDVATLLWQYIDRDAVWHDRVELERAQQLTSLHILNLAKAEDWLAKIETETGKGHIADRDWYVAMRQEIDRQFQQQFARLEKNELENLFTHLARLKKLTHLDLSNNDLIYVPIEIAQLTNLTHLNLSNNQIQEFPELITKLSSLQYLNLQNNNIKVVSRAIGELENLSFLKLNNNQLEELPKSIGELTKLERLELNENPLSQIPPEIFSLGGLGIWEYYRQQIGQEVDRIYEAKLLIIGEGGVGKTTLAKKIQFSDYQLQDENSTQGIDVIQWKFPLHNSKEFRVNIWDFGGQEIYHDTHQFFFSKRTLYILVVDARREDTDFYYWLNLVKLLSDNSPLLIIKNERQDKKREINERLLRDEFTNLKEILSTNLETNRGLPEILKQIKHHISNLPHVGTELPKTWIKVRQALEQDSRNHISLDEYLNLCEHNGFARREDKLQLSEYLHDLGVCLHFQEDELLMRTVILKPTWGIGAVYKVLDNYQVINNQGMFTHDDLKQIWHEDRYATMQPELLRLMMNFKLCYEIPNTPKTYIAPQLLTPNQPDYAWDESKNLLLRYEYEFMPKGILTRFIVEMHDWIESQARVWKSGVVLSKDDARAEITELYRYHKGEIRIRVSGRRQRDLLTTIRHEFRKIHDSYNSSDDRLNKVQRLKYKTLIPCNCSTCKDSNDPYFYSLDIIHKFCDAHKDIQCQNSFDMVNVYSLIDDIVPKTYSPSNAIKLRSEGAKNDIEGELEIRNEKLAKQQSDLSIEAGTAIEFQIANQVEQEITKIQDLEYQLNELSGSDELENENSDIEWQEIEFEVVTIEFCESSALVPFDFEVATLIVSETNIVQRTLRQSGIKIERSPGRAYHFIELLNDQVILEMVQIPAGEFVMGAPKEELKSDDSERPQHSVDVPEFYLGKYPITQEQWRFGASLPKIDYELKPDPSYYKGNNLPVETVSWFEATEFCARLSHHTKREYRLPSEAEWEYACRAGTTTPFYFGETITTDLANYNGKDSYGRGDKGTESKNTTAVNKFPPNAFGLYDLHGNVWEWCQDHDRGHYKKAPTDGSAWFIDTTVGNAQRIARGGNFFFSAHQCRSASRYGLYSDSKNFTAGFRIACSANSTI